MSETETRPKVEELTDGELALIVWQKLSKEGVIYANSYEAKADHELAKRFPK